MKLQNKMTVLILGLILLLTIAGSLFTLTLISTILEKQIGSRALKVSQSVALIPAIKEDLQRGNPQTSRIQELAERIRRETGAQFIVVGDKDGRRYSHPVVERLGQLMVGGDNDRALVYGQSYISKATGTLGPSIRGKVPVFGDDGRIIGIVSVGYLVENVNSIIHGYYLKILSVFTIIVLLGIALTIKITSDLKNAIFGLEPEEIATLLQEKTATLEAIREGIMAIDSQGNITTVNRAAFDTLGIDKNSDPIGRHVTEVIPETLMLEVLATGKSQLDKVLHHGEKELIVNRIPIIIGNRVTGVVSSFRDKSELDILAKKLSQVKKYSEMLRTQTHEYSNKLHTISGLIQIGGYQEAIELIGSETSGYQQLINTLMNIVPDPVVAGTILGKYNKARELKIDMLVDPDSSMSEIPGWIGREHLVTILGNILDNAFEAVRRKNGGQKIVRLAMTDLGQDLIFEIDDSGPGLEPDLYDKVFDKGYSSKDEQGHGMGLYLVESHVTGMGGTINIGRSELGGCAITVILPKTR
ncbi:ATP-binding protein [Desulforhopalus singaporensis]|nr:sensor histidine kinase [Desulforhopalus singaporensis]